MRRAFVTSPLILLAVLMLAGCGSSNPEQAGTQKDFGVRMARMNLWREAMFRFKRAVEMEPNDAMAHNNLAVAYEANGDFDKAGEEYRTAIRLDKSNSHIQKNYSRFVEFTQRNKKRQQPKTGAPVPPTTTTAQPAAPQIDPPPLTSPVPPPPKPPATPTHGGAS